MAGLIQIAYFLLGLAFNILIYATIARLLLQFYRVSGINPICQLVAKATDFAVLPLRKILPNVRVIDIASIVFLALVIMMKMLVISWLFNSIGSFNPLQLIYLTVFGLIIFPCKFLFFAILIRVISSWINPGLHNPMMQALYVITEPLLRLGRKIIPDISGFDFSPFIISIILILIPLFIASYVPGALY